MGSFSWKKYGVRDSDGNRGNPGRKIFQKYPVGRKKYELAGKGTIVTEISQRLGGIRVKRRSHLHQLLGGADAL